MASGGARARSGPVADPRSGRSDARGLRFEVLPVEGYQGMAPEFPLPEIQVYATDSEMGKSVDWDASDARNARERELWEQVWRYPQAVAWAREPWRTYSVAEWVRLAVLCETSEAKAADVTSKLRLAEQIGLTPAGLSLNGWQVGVEPAAPVEAERKVERRRTARDRVAFEVVSNDSSSD